MNAVLKGQKTQDNIKAIISTKAAYKIGQELREAGISARDVDMNLINDRYRMLGGNEEVQPRTIGAVQDALILME